MDLFIYGALFGTAAGILLVALCAMSKRCDHE